jgi:hypothetical protein
MNEKKLCGAKTRSGKACQGKAMENGRCWYHGGNTPGGIASPSFKHGKYSKYLPSNLASNYETALSNPDLISVRDDIALVEARLLEVLTTLGAGGAEGRVWDTLTQQYDDLVMAISENDRQAVVKAMQGMDRMLKDAVRLSSIWKEAQDLLRLKKDLSESERKISISLQTSLSAEQAMTLIQMVAHVIKSNVTDRKVVQKIQNELNLVLAARNE